MKRYIAIAALALVATGCENGSMEVQNPNEIRVEASLGGTRATLTDFEEGDTMGLFAVEYTDGVQQPLQLIGNYLSNEPLTYNNGEWTPNKTLFWSDKPCDFYGIYPYQELGTLKNFLFDLTPNQAGEGYEASDLMWANHINVSREDGAVQLPFQHLMSRLVVDIVRGPKYEGDLPEDIDVHVYNTATTALVDLAAGNLEKYQLSEKNTITMRQLDGDTFDAIIVPQHIERNTPLVEITMEGIAYLLEYSISFRPGHQHTITVTLNTSPDQEKIEISIDGEVGGWE